MKIALLLLALAACGDDSPAKMPDAGMDPDAMTDGGTMAPALTSYVMDLITNQTTATAQPRPYSEFATLPDPDGDANNGGAYSSLF